MCRECQMCDVSNRMKGKQMVKKNGKESERKNVALREREREKEESTIKESLFSVTTCYVTDWLLVNFLSISLCLRCVCREGRQRERESE